MRKIDWADREAERLFDMVRDAKPDQEVVDAIAAALRAARTRKVVDTSTRSPASHARYRTGRG